MALAYIGIGSNMGDRQVQLDLARQKLSQLPGTQLLAMSRAYENPPVGPVTMGDFLNAAAALRTTLPPLELLDHLRQIEADAGRPPESRRIKWGPRPLDLDILSYDEQIIDSERLQVPHPHMHERRFVLEPLSQIAPTLMHPTLGQTIVQLLAGLPADEQ